MSGLTTVQRFLNTLSFKPLCTLPLYVQSSVTVADTQPPIHLSGLQDKLAISFLLGLLKFCFQRLVQLL